MVKSKTSKRIKSSIGSSNNRIDRISNLPDPIISQILSFLPTKDAVATSVLSTRWKFLWTFITNLDFVFFDCGRHNWGRVLPECDIEKSEIEKRVRINRRKFTRIVKSVLLHLNSPSIHKFHLDFCCGDCFNLKYLTSWISAGFGRAVGEFSLSVEPDQGFELRIIKICCNLAVLKLHAEIYFNIPAAAASSLCFQSLKALDFRCVTCVITCNLSIIFPNLKIMRLESVIFPNEGSVYNLFASSPLLEDLSIQDSWYNIMEGLIIHIPSLTRLSISMTDDDYEDMCKLKINAPALQYLYLNCLLTRECLIVENLPSLLQADVRMYFYDKHDVHVESCIGIINFLGRLSKVKSLYLTCDRGQDFKILSTNIISDAHNLTQLEMNMPKCLDLSMMTSSFLESMVNLEYLVLKPSSIRDGGLSWWVEPLTVPKCLLSRLTTVSFTGIRTDCHDLLELLRYFLKNAKVLQMLTVSTNRLSKEQQLVLLKKISLMPRASNTCQVAFT